MFREHYPALVVAYAAALVAWAGANRLRPVLWPRAAEPELPRGWREFGVAMLGVAGVIAMGQLWSRGYRLPDANPLLAAANQLLIFSPLLAVPLLRRQRLTTAWLPWPHLGGRLVAGLLISFVALTAYSTVRAGAAAPWTLVARVWQPAHLDGLVQVFCEDVAIAILFVRLAAGLGRLGATVIVACLFAAAHLPAMLSAGASWHETAGLLRDAALGTGVMLVLQRSRDVVWFWLVHFTMDMTQFARVSGVA